MGIYMCHKCKEEFDERDRDVPLLKKTRVCPNCGISDRYLEMIEED